MAVRSHWLNNTLSYFHLFTNVHTSNLAQAFLLGRYAIHWHMHGQLQYKQYIRGCAIHHSYQRAVTVHGTHQV
jgi:hypothetical protein